MLWSPSPSATRCGVHYSIVITTLSMIGPRRNRRSAGCRESDFAHERWNSRHFVHTTNDGQSLWVANVLHVRHPRLKARSEGSCSGVAEHRQTAAGTEDL